MDLTMLQNVNCWSVLVAAISSFVLGGIWYAKPVFGLLWCREAGVDLIKPTKKGHSVIVFTLVFLLSLVAATVFAVFLGPQPSLRFAVTVGLAIGLAWVMTSFGINYLFARRSIKLFFIDGGYHTLQFMLYGIILGLWR
jgi:hypothetical protein